jgi:hypothetical protein
MPYHTPERKCEQALKLYFATILEYELQGWQVVTRFGNEVKTEPRIEIYCPDAEPWEEEANAYTGNWAVTCMIKMVSHYEEGVDAEAHDIVSGNLLDSLMLADTTTGASAAAAQINLTQFEADLTVLLVDIKTRTNSIEEHSLITEQELVLYVKPSR